ncbi:MULTISPECIES: sugar ABC transporter substrate-binding protein [unclassified Mesorhizobium]|uniref:sugar ABC transporter substrate-binding protein n=1 Tax=unclassified Mesorhizobium TaxID=325217 RepID=UPI000BB07E05|nr:MULTISPECIES: sugar ABC transporter substrate-binding protein [unclassified Mesorhizobium]PBB43496.1 sugar ABC transporter substrate-binding protein [Mesorhizobium sp. WSM3866]RUV94884.1 sugar ABC transporter substrate-binding protein [Mesorhizobium sp. M1A.F.Ca.IN.020.04.1.1]RUW08220.1 sugar ABC transporter substrate-binding protein [Mesorhizobium sp. M1A.F.Ca.IN.020.03.1.1]RWG13064.1 MAG: sugar ABC transporter substrate-binding protein [Mesorhizobium sp.]RWG32594.1 MAG: sugar ABC transpor
MGCETKSLTLNRRALLQGAAATAGGLLLAGGERAAAQGTTSKVVAWETGYLGFFFFVVLQEALKRKVESLGLEFVGKDANGDANAQVNDWNSLLLQKPRYLISDALDSELLIPLSKKAKSLGVPLGMVDTVLTGGEVAASVTFDNKQSGVMAAEKTAELLTKKHGSPKGSVLNNYGSLTAVALRDRKDGFEDTLKSKYPDIEIISRPQSNQHEQALAVVSATLRERPDLDAIHMPTDIFVVDARKALETQKRLFPVGHEKHIILTSIDASPNALEWVKAGEIDADIAQDPIAYVEIVVDLLEEYTLKGKPVPTGPYENKKYFWEKGTIADSPSGPLLTIPPYFLTKENADDPRHWANVVTQVWKMQQNAG